MYLIMGIQQATQVYAPLNDVGDACMAAWQWRERHMLNSIAMEEATCPYREQTLEVAPQISSKALEY